MWVKLKSNYKIEKGGKMAQRVAGDWIKVGKQEAGLLIAQNRAELPGQDVIREFAGGGKDAGILALGSPVAAALVLEELKGKLNVKYGDESPWLPWAKTIIWDTSVILRTEMIPTGLGLLDTWQIAMPLWDKYSLAIHEGDEDDRAQTKAIVRDLRVPLYDTRLIYARECDETKQLFAQWSTEREKGASTRLAFLRAFYQVKPLMLALPITWTGQYIDMDR